MNDRADTTFDPDPRPSQGKAKTTRKFAAVKRMIKPSDPRLKENVEKAAKKVEVEKKKEEKKRVNPLPASLFLSHNEALGPPYRVLVDTNFINFSLQNKIELVQGMMDCLMAKCESRPGVQL